MTPWRFLPLVFLVGCFDRLELHYDVDLRHGTVHVTEHLRNITFGDGSHCDSVAACLEALKADLASEAKQRTDMGARGLASSISVRAGEVDYTFVFDQPLDSPLFTSADDTSLVQAVQVSRARGRPRTGLLLRTPDGTTERADVRVDGPFTRIDRPGGAEEWLLVRGRPKVDYTVTRMEADGTPTHGDPWVASVPGLAETLATLSLTGPR